MLRPYKSPTLAVLHFTTAKIRDARRGGSFKGGGEDDGFGWQDDIGGD